MHINLIRLNKLKKAFCSPSENRCMSLLRVERGLSNVRRRSERISRVHAGS
jgi:hypothetical protein